MYLPSNVHTKLYSDLYEVSEGAGDWGRVRGGGGSGGDGSGIGGGGDSLLTKIPSHVFTELPSNVRTKLYSDFIKGAEGVGVGFGGWGMGW